MHLDSPCVGMVGAQKLNLSSWLQCPSVGTLRSWCSSRVWDRGTTKTCSRYTYLVPLATEPGDSEGKRRVWAILTAWRKGTHMGLGDVGTSPRVSDLSGSAAAGATSQRKTCRCFQQRLEKGTEPREVVALPSQLPAGAASRCFGRGAQHFELHLNKI